MFVTKEEFKGGNENEKIFRNDVKSKRNRK